MPWQILLVWAIYLLLLKPRLVLHPGRIEIVNILRRYSVPWAEVERLGNRFQLSVHLRDGRRIACWGAPATGLDRRRSTDLSAAAGYASSRLRARRSRRTTGAATHEIVEGIMNDWPGPTSTVVVGWDRLAIVITLILVVLCGVDGWSPRLATELSRGRIRAEILLVLGVSLGASAVYSVVEIVDLTTRKTSLSHQSAALNTSLSSRPTFDLIYQFLGLFFDVVPVALVAFLLWQAARPHLGRLGLDLRHPWRDLGVGVLLALVIGAGGIGVYLGGRALGVTVNVSADGLGSYWWTVPILLLSALRAALQEEVIVVGYLYARLRELGWNKWVIIVATSVLRGSYHLYQGFGAFVGNFVMGMLFGWLYTRYGRVLPLVIAHFLIDAAVFVGYSWAASTFPALF